MPEGGERDPNGKLFYTKSEQVNGVLGDKKIVSAKRAGRSPRDEEVR